MQFWPRRGHSAPRRQQSAAGSPFQAHQCERPGQSCHHECYIGEMFASLLNARDRYYMIAASLGLGPGDSDHNALALLNGAFYPTVILTNGRVCRCSCVLQICS